jgi:hypothetical protein
VLQRYINVSLLVSGNVSLALNLFNLAGVRNDPSTFYGFNMKKLILIAILSLFSNLAIAQNSNNSLCFTTNGTNCVPVTSSNPLPSSVSQGGNTASVSLDGALSVNTPPNPQFFDAFSSTLDTVTNWTTNNSGGSTATSAGSLVVSGTTTASQYGGLSTKQAWTASGGSLEYVAASISYNTLAVTNSVRIFGSYTSPATPTLAAPITDGYVFRLDATGNLFAEVWASGAPVSSTNITAVQGCTPIAGVPFVYFIGFRSNLVAFGCNNNPTAAVATVNPVNQTLPISAYSIAGLSNPGAVASMSVSALTLVSYAPGGVKSSNQSPTINDPTTVTAMSPIAAISTAALAANQIVLSGAGNLNSFEVSADATLSAAPWWIMIFDATAAPADGAVTPKKCFAQASGVTSYAAAFPAPIAFGTGITIGVSTTGCFTKTASVHAFISGDAK